MKQKLITIALLIGLWVSALLPLSGQTAQPAPEKPKVAQNELALAGVTQKTTIRRDNRGIPYIEAANDADLYFAQGYATAEDRLFEMDLLRRTARGELSEIFGATTLEQDKRWRRYGFAQLAHKQLTALSPAARTMLESYARGVNAYIVGHSGAALPPEFGILRYSPRPWEPTDTLAAMKIFADALSSSWDTDIMRASLADLPPAKRAALLPETSSLDVLVVGQDAAPKRANISPGDPLMESQRVAATFDVDQLETARQVREESLARVGLYAEDRAASNNWVVSGKRTASGKPLLANDPHLQPSAPGIWHMVNLTAPGVHVAGVTMPGAPGVVLGHNEHIAWGATNLGPDVQDLYAEKFDPQDAKRYQTAAGWRDAEIRTEQIKVRKSFLDTAVDTIPFDVTVTRHGPIFFESGGTRYALRWPALDADTGEVDALYQMNRAKNWAEFTSGLSKYGGPTQNFVYADDGGNIGYYGAGRIPIRKQGDGSVPYDGATDEGEWTGYLPFAELPHVYNPPDGLIITANQRVVGTGYKPFLTHEWAQPFRARRIAELLQGKTKLTADDFRDVQRDVYSIFVADFAREVVKLADADPSAAGADQEWKETIALFRGWDGRLAADSKAAPVASQLVGAFTRKILVAALGPERAKAYEWGTQNMLIRQLMADRPKDWLPSEYPDYLSLLRACVKEARAALSSQLGPDPEKWTWGALRVGEFPHPIGRIPLIGGTFKIPGFPMNGGSSTVNVGTFVSMRFIADPSDWDKTRHGVPLGESGLPSSPHWNDQFESWRTGNTPVFPFSNGAVESATAEVLTLTPKGN